MSLDYWYDGQLRRYWMQFCRIFEGFQYESGVGAGGTKTLRTFPVSLAGKNRQVGHILRNGSENTMLSTPRITCEMIDIQQSSERRQTPNHVSTVNIFERAIDPATKRYTGELGKTYTVERFMAIPYDITMRVNIWTSNEQQKHQFMEQVLVLFNPSIDIQTGDNPIDWTSLTIVELESVTWSNRELPIGTEDDIEIATLTFKMPIWLTPPAKIKRQNIIHQIITNIGEMNKNYVGDQAGGYNFSSNDLHTRVIVTPGDHQVRVDVENINGQRALVATLLSQEGHTLIPEWQHLSQDDIYYYQGSDDKMHRRTPGEVDAFLHNKVYDWKPLLQRQGQYRQGVSQFRLKTTDNMDDHESDIIGPFDFYNVVENKIIWAPDFETMPTKTLETISGVLDLSPVSTPIYKEGDPHVELPISVPHWPGNGSLPEAVDKQRYLLASDLYHDPNPVTRKWDFGVPDFTTRQFVKEIKDTKTKEVIEVFSYTTDENTAQVVAYDDLPGLVAVDDFVIRGNELVLKILGNKWEARRIIESAHATRDPETKEFTTSVVPNSLVVASINDIIEYNAVTETWHVAFDASNHHEREVVLNGKTGAHLRWTGEMWVDAICGDYNPGYWRVFL